MNSGSRAVRAMILGAALILAGLLSIWLRVRVAPLHHPDFAIVPYGLYFTLAAITGLCALGPRWLPVVPGLLCAAGLIVGPSTIDDTRRSMRTTSCANHISFAAKDVARWAPLGKAFEKTTEFREILIQMEPTCVPDGSFYCPGRIDTSHESGYVFVAGGLRPKDLPSGTLLFFCAAQCHPENDHRHAVVAPGELVCCDRDTLAPRIAGAITQGERKEVGFSPEAMSLLRSELTKLTR